MDEAHINPAEWHAELRAAFERACALPTGTLEAVLEREREERERVKRRAEWLRERDRRRLLASAEELLKHYGKRSRGGPVTPGSSNAAPVSNPARASRR